MGGSSYGNGGGGGGSYARGPRELFDATCARCGKETQVPFRPTGAQERAFAEIATDLGAPHPMRRLLQGDVGSGKTLVALMAALTVIEGGVEAQPKKERRA